MPKGKKHGPEQIVAFLRGIEGGESAQAVSREVNIREATLGRWKQQHRAMDIDEVKELKALRGENAHLKRIAAEPVSNIQVLKKANSRKW